MALGMDMLVKSALESMGPEVKAAIEGVPRNVQAIADRLASIDNAQRLTANILQNMAKQLAALESTLNGHTLRISSLQSRIDPSYTPDFDVIPGGRVLPAPVPEGAD